MHPCFTQARANGHKNYQVRRLHQQCATYQAKHARLGQVVRVVVNEVA